ncbi:hypothetical protein C7964_101845 [Loktanella sp. PT4BL]|jgi:phosphopantetheine adenylyltransferase|uniref:hypothetical protein n=1 Tax=Loktanella sp. PT4BL TaxID=2135611 RepID=UPI000D75AE9A|nr:hypothetical protein [Loktanella sp. PT4BL]PXW72729.1 hypothetical protein C7964_101845 [Loktanella sp. PT4BL]
MTDAGFIYPQIIDEIRRTSDLHIVGTTSADDLQRLVQRAEHVIIAVEEKDIRAKLTDVEGRLELIKFTVEAEQQAFETTKVAKELLDWLSQRQANQTSA